VAKGHFGIETTVTPMLRGDGTVYFQYPPKPISERLCQWSVVFLWSVVPAVIVATVVWF